MSKSPTMSTPLHLSPELRARVADISRRIGLSRHATMIALMSVGMDATDEAILAAAPKRAWRAGGS